MPKRTQKQPTLPELETLNAADADSESAPAPGSAVGLGLPVVRAGVRVTDAIHHKCFV